MDQKDEQLKQLLINYEHSLTGGGCKLGLKLYDRIFSAEFVELQKLQ